MYVIDVRHYLNDQGVIAVQQGPARKMAEFVTAVVAHASDLDRPDQTPGPTCFKCCKRDDRRVDTSLSDDEIIVWHCPGCGTQGRISGWQRSFWDLSQGMPSG